MISEKILDEYEIAFPNDSIGILEPDGKVFIEASTGGEYVQNDDETDAVFLDRIKRSKEAGENLFYKEWRVLVLEKYNDNWDY